MQGYSHEALRLMRTSGLSAGHMQHRRGRPPFSCGCAQSRNGRRLEQGVSMRGFWNTGKISVFGRSTHQGRHRRRTRSGFKPDPRWPASRLADELVRYARLDESTWWTRDRWATPTQMESHCST